MNKQLSLSIKELNYIRRVLGFLDDENEGEDKLSTGIIRKINKLLEVSNE